MANPKGNTMLKLLGETATIGPIFEGVNDIYIKVENGRKIQFGYKPAPPSSKATDTSGLKLLAEGLEVRPYKFTKWETFNDSLKKLGSVGKKAYKPKQPLKFFLDNPEMLNTRKNGFRVKEKSGHEVVVIIYRNNGGIVAEKHSLDSSPINAKDLVLWVPLR